ncbi:hypothetical protein [Ureibacillus acetophenoni]
MSPFLKRTKELQKPSTILIPDENIEHFKLDNMTEEEKEQVKEHVLSFMDKL